MHFVVYQAAYTLCCLSGCLCILLFIRMPIYFVVYQDAYASTDLNGNDDDPMPRYDPTNENKYVFYVVVLFSFLF